MTTGFSEIKFSSLAGDINSVVSMTPEIVQLLNNNKVDTSGINEVYWPIGASNHAVARFVVHERTLTALNPAAGEIKVPFSFDGLEFQMFMMTPTPLYPSDNGMLELYVIELVDERYYWNIDSVNVGPEKLKHGINIAKPKDRVDLLIQTTQNPATWKGDDVINEILQWKSNSIGFNTNLWTGLNLIDGGGLLGEYHFTGQPLGEVIDYVLQAYGCVLVALPNSNVAEFGKRYQIQLIKNGASKASYAFSSGLDAALITGGFKAEFNGNNLQGFGTTNSELAINEVPTQVEVHFPVAVEDNKYRKDMSVVDADEQDIDFDEAGEYNFTTDRWRGYVKTTGRGSLHSPIPMTKSVYSHQWARFRKDEDSDGQEQYTFLNSSQLSGIASDISSIYYSRFSCGACDLEIRGILGSPTHDDFLVLWAGAQEVVWSIGLNGPKTTIKGDYHHPLFGFNDNKPLKQSDIHSVGDTRTFYRSSGGLLIEGRKDSPPQIDLYLGEITEVFGPEQGWDIVGYSAVAYTNPELTEDVIYNYEPERMHDPLMVDIMPAEIGQVCIIGVIPPGGVQGLAEAGSGNHPDVVYGDQQTGPLPPILVPEQDEGLPSVYGGSPVTQLQAMAQMFGPISSTVNSGVVETYPQSPGTQRSARQRSSRRRGSNPNETEYVLFVWEYPLVVQCSAEPPDGRRAAESDMGFFGSYISRMHGY